MVHHLYSLLPTLIVILGGERKEGEEGKQREEKEEDEEEKKKKEEAKDKIKNLKGRNISHISRKLNNFLLPTYIRCLDVLSQFTSGKIPTNKQTRADLTH